MIRLIKLTLILATLYGGYWFVGRNQVQTRLETALTNLNAGPYNLTFDSLSTRGFPSRFDTTITNLQFDDPASGTGWSADPFQLFALSYRPNEVIAYFPQEQEFRINGQPFTLRTIDMRASGKIAANTALSFLNATITMELPRLQTPTGTEFSMARLLAAVRLTPETTEQYDLYLNAEELSLPADLRQRIDPQSTLPAAIQSLRFDSDLTLNTPIALNRSTEIDPKITTLQITEFALSWGDVSLVVIGDLTPDATGRLNGSLTLTARNWQTLLDLIIATGALTEDRRAFALTVAENIDETPHINDTLTATVSFVDGEMSLSGLPLGSAPRF